MDSNAAFCEACLCFRRVNLGGREDELRAGREIVGVVQQLPVRSLNLPGRLHRAVRAEVGSVDFVDHGEEEVSGGARSAHSQRAVVACNTDRLATVGEQNFRGFNGRKAGVGPEKSQHFKQSANDEGFTGRAESPHRVGTPGGVKKEG
jgi:hypothetical protein